MQRDRLPYLLIPAAALIAVLPLILHGCSCGHDFDFHLVNWFEAARQFTHGNLHPHWAYTPAWNAGEPRFIFYPPLSWTIGGLLGLVLPWTATPIVFTWLSLTAAGLSLYSLARSFAIPTAALLAAAFYTVNPYMLFTAYERTAYAELLAAACIPLLLHAILRDRVTIPRIALPIALLWLTNAPAAVMASYALALLTLIRLLTTKKLPPPTPNTQPGDAPLTTIPGAPSSPRLLRLTWASRESATAPLRLAATTTAGTLLGLGLAAFYLLPAAYERRYVQISMATLPGMRIQDNFLFHPTPPGTQSDPFHDIVLHTASLLAVTLIALTVIAILLAARRTKQRPHPKTSRPNRNNPGAPSSPRLLRLRWASRKARPSSSSPAPAPPETPSPLLPLAILTLTLTFLLTPLSAPIWHHLPELAFLQFPWRLIALLAPILALAAATALSPLTLKPIPTAAIALALAASLTATCYTLYRQSCDEEDTVQGRLAVFLSTSGTEPTDEYTPLSADNDTLSPRNPAYWLADDPQSKAPASNTPAPAPTHLTLSPPTPKDLILNLRDYPTWRITRNGEAISTRLHRDDGLIAIPLPAGPSTISITETPTLDQTLGSAITQLSLVLLLLLTIRRKLRHEDSSSDQREPHPEGDTHVTK